MSKKKLPSASIRIMGDKQVVDKILPLIIKTLEESGMDFTAPRSYPMYKDKKKRKEIDPNRSRIYINVYGTYTAIEEQ